MRNSVLIQKFSPRYNLLLVALTLISAFLACAGSEPQTAKAAGLEGWRDTGITLSTQGVSYPAGAICVDATQPNVFALPGAGGIYSYNWVTGTSHQLNSVTFQYCNDQNGLIYGNDSNGRPVRFTVANPQPQFIDRVPTVLPSDGSLLSYAYGNDKKLWFSPDGGSAWQERPKPGNGDIISMTTATSDAHVLYAVVRETGSNDRTLKYTVYRSYDTGQNWAAGFSGEAGGIYFQPSASLFSIKGRSVPVNFVRLDVNNGGAGSSGHTATFISSDSGATFRGVAESGISGSLNSFFYSNDGLVRKFFTSFSISYDGGVSWQPLNSPYDFNTYIGSTARVEFAPVAPANLFSMGNGDGKLYYSPDNARTWRVLAAAPESFIATPYAPLTLLGVSDRRLYVLDLKDADKTETLPVAPTNALGGTYFQETRHNLRGIFKEYWEKYGGLAQFGYPKTEEFREFNPSDGKVYLVQYYERNRFEYHPENAGTKYEVLLGLLGNQLTEQRRAAGDGAFNRFDNLNYPGGAYFAETGHNLRNSFKAYWEANGGLFVYGFPISEEFMEVNPDDGQTYVVQYFERNRFEYHPENKGTKYEVLLGLLGNSLLKQKGWL